MSILTAELKAQKVLITDDTLALELSDGRDISVPLAWFPRLLHGTPEERSNWRYIGDNEGIHWTDLDEDISVENLLMGPPSGESQSSFKKWLEKTRIGLKRWYDLADGKITTEKEDYEAEQL